MSIVGAKKTVTDEHGRQACWAMKVSQGSFSKVINSNFAGGQESWAANKWFFCREWFQGESQGITRILYSHKKNQTEDIARFIRKVENKLKLPVKSQIGPTQRSTISWIKVVPFWTRTEMRRSFFTMMLRCGQNYDWEENNFEDALFSIRYTRETPYAVGQFLKGHTKYCGRNSGWYDEFKFRPEGQIDRLLVKPQQNG